MREFQERDPKRVFAIQFIGDNLEEIASSCTIEPGLASMHGEIAVLRWGDFHRIALVPKDWLVVEDGVYRPMTDEDFCRKYERIGSFRG